MKCRNFLSWMLIVTGFISCDSSEEMYGPAETVTTHFTLSLDSKQAKTRQMPTVVQQDGSFNGMRDIVMIPFKLNKPSENNIVATSPRYGNNIELPQANALPETDEPNSIKNLNSANNSQLYKEVAIESGTNAFLFYGEATPASGATKAQSGSIISKGFDKDYPSDISFNLESIVSTADKTKAGYLMDYLTAIANTTGWEATTAEPMSVLRQDFISMTAGSSANVLAMVQDLYFTLSKNTDDLSKNISDVIVQHEYQQSKRCVTSAAEGILTFDEALSGWPTLQGLPDGSVQIEWNEAGKKFVEKAGDNAGLQITASEYAHYAFPASLYYMTSSKIKVSGKSIAEKYKEEGAWDVLLNEYETDNGTVVLTTRSIALKTPVDYAVARMDTKVWIEGTSLTDYNGKETPYADKDSKPLFPVTGILVGGQRTVDFLFQPMETGHAEYTIYDNDVPDDWFLTTENAKTNHTLLFPSYGQADNGKVRVALEIQNNSQDFSGTGGKLIPLGCKFYLVAELNAKGETDVGERVFLNDRITTVHFKVSSLKEAYNVIPDLRLPELELGLGVNISWNEHLSLGVEIK